MRLNEVTGMLPTSFFYWALKLTKMPNAAVSTAKALLVPYDRRHVLTYHAWMEDPVCRYHPLSHAPGRFCPN